LGPRPPVLGNGNGSVVYSYILLKGRRSTHRFFFELGSLNGGCAWLSNFRAITELVLNNLNSNDAINYFTEWLNYYTTMYKPRTKAVQYKSCIHFRNDQ